MKLNWLTREKPCRRGLRARGERSRAPSRGILPAIEALEARRGPEARSWLFTGKASRSYLEVDFALGDLLVFGKESVGLPDALLEAHPERCVGIPTLGAVRSLNLANSVAIVLFEALRQTGCLDLTQPGPGALSPSGDDALA